MASDVSLQEFPIHKLYAECLQWYRDIYIALAEHDGFVLHQIPMPQFSDEYGRLGIWGRNSRADCVGRGSLDDNLRSDNNLRSIILDLLRAFGMDLKEGESFHLRLHLVRPHGTYS